MGLTVWMSAPNINSTGSSVSARIVRLLFSSKMCWYLFIWYYPFTYPKSPIWPLHTTFPSVNVRSVARQQTSLFRHLASLCTLPSVFHLNVDYDPLSFHSPHGDSVDGLWIPPFSLGGCSHNGQVIVAAPVILYTTNNSHRSKLTKAW